MSKLYSRSHEWIEEVEEGKVRLGLTDFAQEQLGDIVYINLPEVGDTFEAEDVLGDIESIKAVSDIICPIAGTVAEVNEDLLDAPEGINEAADETWLVVLENVDDMDDLLTEEEYQEFCETEE